MFGWAADQPVEELQIKFGVSEERKTFVLDLAGHAHEDRRGLS
jgi:alpha-galactosidase